MPRKPAKPLTPEQINDRETWHPLARKVVFLGNPVFLKNFIWLSIIGLVLMVLLGLIFPLHKTAPWDFFGSWAVIGFVSYSFVVLASWPLFRLLSRREDYYADEYFEDTVVKKVAHHD